MSYQYQVVVIGSGSAGKEACLSAAKAGLHQEINVTLH